MTQKSAFGLTLYNELEETIFLNSKNTSEINSFPRCYSVCQLSSIFIISLGPIQVWYGLSTVRYSAVYPCLENFMSVHRNLSWSCTFLPHTIVRTKRDVWRARFKSWVLNISKKEASKELKPKCYFKSDCVCVSYRNDWHHQAWHQNFNIRKAAYGYVTAMNAEQC